MLNCNELQDLTYDDKANFLKTLPPPYSDTCGLRQVSMHCLHNQHT